MKVSGTELARLRGVDRKTVTNWLNETPPCPSTGTGSARRVNLVDFADWWAERAVRQAAAAAPREEADEARERARKMRADADLSELKVARAREELVDVTAVIRSHERLCAVVRAKVSAIRGKWAPRVIGLATMGEATQAMDRLAADILAALVDGADELDDEPEQEAA